MRDIKVGSDLRDDNDINLTANNDVVVTASRLDAGRDINVKGRDVTFDVAKCGVSESTQNTESLSGIHGGTSGCIYDRQHDGKTPSLENTVPEVSAFPCQF